MLILVLLLYAQQPSLQWHT